MYIRIPRCFQNSNFKPDQSSSKESKIMKFGEIRSSKYFMFPEFKIKPSKNPQFIRLGAEVVVSSS